MKPDALPLRKADANLVYADDVPAKTAAAGFLAEFGASFEQTAVHTDVTGLPLVIGRQMFVAGGDKAGDNFKWLQDAKKGRFKYMQLLANTVLDPQEVWQVWEPRRDEPGRWILQRYYLKAFTVDEAGKKRKMIAAFRYDSDGYWDGATVFHTVNPTYANNKRQGLRVYQK